MSKILIEVAGGAVTDVYGTEAGMAFVRDKDANTLTKLPVNPDPQLVSDAERDCVFTSSDVEEAQSQEEAAA